MTMSLLNIPLLASSLLVGAVTQSPAQPVSLAVEQAEASEVAQTEGAPAEITPAPDPAFATLAQLQAVYDDMADFSADFTQRYTNLAAGDTRELQGTVYFLRPGMMRWDYSVPDSRHLVTDGETFWSVEPAQQQYFEAPLAEAELPTALRFLTGEATLSDDFTVRELDDSSAELSRLELMPREPTGDYEYLVFDVQRSTGYLMQIAIYDAFGNENTFAFSESQFDVGLDASAFQYTPAPEYTRVEAPESP